MNITVIEQSYKNSRLLKVAVRTDKPVVLPMGTSLIFKQYPLAKKSLKYFEQKIEAATNLFLSESVGIVVTLTESITLDSGNLFLPIAPNHPEIPCEYICSNSLDLLDMDISFEQAMQCSQMAGLLRS
jgi:hypothetical protein